jgi:hypothetical protein
MKQQKHKSLLNEKQKCGPSLKGQQKCEQMLRVKEVFTN